MKINVQNKIKYYDVIIEDNLIDYLETFFDSFEKCLVVTDTNIPQDLVKKVQERLERIGKVYLYKIKAGEESKNIDNYINITKVLIEEDFSKSDYIVALGGGVTGDLTGFVAGTYKRGMKFINIPTSTLSMIDSSIGGKNGIDYNDVKNALGVYYMPEKVLISLNTLNTLPIRHYNNGLMEALKMGLCLDENLFNLFTESILDIKKVIILSLENKKKIVEKDPFEENVRKVLNFGHTIGHSIEILNKDVLLHGEAVGLGMLVFMKDKAIDLKKIINKYIDLKSLESKSLILNKDLLLEKTMNDKKWYNGKITVVTVPKLGEYKLEEMTKEELKEIIYGFDFWK